LSGPGAHLYCAAIGFAEIKCNASNSLKCDYLSLLTQTYHQLPHPADGASLQDIPIGKSASLPGTAKRPNSAKGSRPNKIPKGSAGMPRQQHRFSSGLRASSPVTKKAICKFLWSRLSGGEKS